MTPIRVDTLRQLLRDSNYNVEISNRLVKGFEGFDIGYRGPMKRCDTADNIPFHVGDKFDMWSKIMKEVKLCRYAGPYRDIPYSSFVQSPIGLVPKSGGKTRLIFHLSFDYSTYKSVNHYTPEEVCTVRYKDLDHAVKVSSKLKSLAGDNFDGVVYSKTDVTSAFRVLPVKVSQCFLLVLKAPIRLRESCTILSLNASCLDPVRVAPYFRSSLMHWHT